jgi:hypothetical protein
MGHVWVTGVDGDRALRPRLEFPSAVAVAAANAFDVELAKAMQIVVQECLKDKTKHKDLGIIREKWMLGNEVRNRVHPLALASNVDPLLAHRAAYTYISPILAISARADRFGADEISLCVLLASQSWDRLPGKNLRWADWWSILEAPNLRRDARLIALVASRIESTGSRNVRDAITAFRHHFRDWNTTVLSDEALASEVESVAIGASRGDK